MPSAANENRLSPPADPVVRLPHMTFHSATTHLRNECDVSLRVEFQMNGSRLRGALLSNFVEGICETLVAPQRRYYALTLKGMDCGSRIYAGQIELDGGATTLVVTDHSGRTCTDRRPSLIELEETDEHGITRKFYGNWQGH